MKILIAKNAGFCMGVRRAVEMVLDAPNKHENPICTFGPLIHNPQVLDLLREKEISTLEHVPEYATGTVLIRAHGVPPQTKKNLKKAGFKIAEVGVHHFPRKAGKSTGASLKVIMSGYGDMLRLFGKVKRK